MIDLYDFTVIEVLHENQLSYICSRCYSYVSHYSKFRVVYYKGKPMKWLCVECAPTTKDALEYAYTSYLTEKL